MVCSSSNMDVQRVYIDSEDWEVEGGRGVVCTRTQQSGYGWHEASKEHGEKVKSFRMRSISTRIPIMSGHYTTQSKCLSLILFMNEWMYTYTYIYTCITQQLASIISLFFLHFLLFALRTAFSLLFYYYPIHLYA